MRRSTRITISLLLKIFLLSSSLPMLSASPVWAQECTKEEIKTNLHRLGSRSSVDINSAYNLFHKCGSRSLKHLIIILQDPTEKLDVKSYAAFALGQIGSGSKEAVNALIAFLKDSKINSYSRITAAQALGQIGSGSKEAINALIAFLKDPTTNPYSRITAAQALGQIGSGSKEAINALIAFLKDPTTNPTDRNDILVALGQIGLGSEEAGNAVVAFLKDPTATLENCSKAFSALSQIGAGSKEAVSTLITFLKQDPENNLGTTCKDHEQVASALGDIGSESEDAINVLIAVLQKEDYRSSLNVSRSAAIALGQISFKLEKTKSKLPSKKLYEFISDLERALNILEANREKVFSEKQISDVQVYLNSLKQEKQSRWQTQIIKVIGQGWLVHIGFWILLITVYPQYSWVQAIFFWNPKVRKIMGLWYVDLALTWIPYLRSKLFAPFSDSLLSDAYLDVFNSQAYFSDSEVILGETGTQPQHRATPKPLSLEEAISEIRGQIILEGESGLGKSMFLRHLVRKAKRIPVYLPAKKCNAGVLEAIQVKLHGYVKEDPNFLKSLIYSGAIDICIDGLNEVTPDTRAKITTFVESYFKGNIIMATQPLEWTPPSTAKTYTLQPLKGEQIEQFLISRRPPILPEDAKIKGSDYEHACKNYLATVLKSGIPEEEIATRRMLSNPMELTIVAIILSQDKTPDLLSLQQQQFDIMRANYERIYPAKTFPLKTFAEAVYQMRLNDKAEISPEEWQEELQCMERHKMVISRQVTDLEGKPKTEWSFRHDKIQDFFIMQTFLGEPKDTRLVDHISDSRFRGVYFLLARLMPVEEAKALREILIDYAADTNDHAVSDTFIQLFRPRQPT
jgi:HEAT repeat protein